MALRIVPLSEVGLGECQAGPHSKSNGCPSCGKLHLLTQCVLDEPFYSVSAGGLAVRVSAYCGHCEHVYTRTFAATLDGEPRAPEIGGAVITVDRRRVEQFLDENPHAREVLDWVG